ncbi:MAG TPA: hypothetical protein VFU16_03390 [Solirubrobacterales bacterium]|nr:hypothetical protein [Solirubrobacterales bacterium]
MARRVGALVLVGLAIGAAAASGVTIQRGELRMNVFAQVKPFKLPRQKPGPIAVFVAGSLQSVKGGLPPQVQSMRVEVNRHGLLQSRGLPVCRPSQIVAASTQRALANCSDALIGSGQFWAHIVLPAQDAYPTRGRLLVFNGRSGKQPTLLAHIYTSNPFNSSFTIAFSIRRIDRGPYGTELSASFPAALGEWGYLDRIKLTLRREYTSHGRHLSYFNAACPAPPKVNVAPFPLARATLFAGERSITAAIDKSCGVKE